MYQFLLSVTGQLYRVNMTTGEAWYRSRNRWILVEDPKV
jgi:hypothetical protein